jgi:gamma-glutamylcyclotransferase (GGCT)/AIG2-like uncharacterized protein YtfP
MTQKTNLVFVYGTLKAGQFNNRLLQRPGADFVCTAKTREPWIMFNGGFPRVARIPRGREPNFKSYLGQIKGEVWKVDDSVLIELDRLESHPVFYCREKVCIVQPGANEAYYTAWMYVIQHWPGGEYEPVTPDKGILDWPDRPSKKWLDWPEPEWLEAKPDVKAIGRSKGKHGTYRR